MRLKNIPVPQRDAGSRGERAVMEHISETV